MTEPILYRCPACDSDMTAEVHKQCALRRPIVIQLMHDAERKSAFESPTVSLECPKGHWAEYECPKIGGS